jgi:aryl-alcohol dehydrogenase-like predicted oxidoreductase
MRYRKLCDSITVSEISFGGVEIGLPYGPHRHLMAESEAIRLLHTAVERGINFFDTARVYGCSEERMGKAFKGRRDKVVICTKCPSLHVSDNSKELRRQVEQSSVESLNALQTDYIDVYLAHSATTEVLGNEDVIEAVERLVRKGVVRVVGVSTYGASDSKIAIESGKWNVVQLVFNLVDQSCEPLFVKAAVKEVGIMARSVLMRGILTDKGVDLTHDALRAVAAHRERYFEMVLKTRSGSLANMAIRFALSFKDVSSVLVGIDKVEFLDSAIQLANGRYFDESVVSKLRQMAYKDPAFLNLAVWDKNGWTK